MPFEDFLPIVRSMFLRSFGVVSEAVAFEAWALGFDVIEAAEWIAMGAGR